jgi:hypothetical protein
VTDWITLCHLLGMALDEHGDGLDAAISPREPG